MDTLFSILTPTYNAYPYIRSCVASVADQQGVTVQHVVQDGLSTDGTAEYVASELRIEGESREDTGMYDAINKAWAKCRGDFVGHLNADEELLPGALGAVTKLFQSDPRIDVVIGGALVCNIDGSLLCHRKPLRPPLSVLLTSHHPIQSCSIFFRRSSFQDRPWLYDPGFRLVSDALLMIDILRNKKAIATLDRFTSVFLITGTNIGLMSNPVSMREQQHLLTLAPFWMRPLRHIIRGAFQLRKLVTGHYRRIELTYELYMPGFSQKRERIQVARASGIFRAERTVSTKREALI